MKQRTLIFIEGPGVNKFWPLGVSRPPYLLRCGVTPLYQKWVRRLHPDTTLFITRPHLAATLGNRVSYPVNRIDNWEDRDLWILDGRWLLHDETEFDSATISESARLRNADRTVALRLNGSDRDLVQPVVDMLLSDNHDFPDVSLDTQEVAGETVEYLWDIVDHNPAQIELEFDLTSYPAAARFAGVIDRAAVIQHPERVLIGANSEIGPQVVLNARRGPIIIGKDVVINPHTYVEGPAVIGDHVQLHGGKIRGGTTIGPVCRVGGEVEACVFQGYANKYHDGFLGHSVVGEWVNFGAMTTNSDLKNNYRPVRVALPGDVVDTGRIKIGTYLADHSKTGIGTLLPTGGTVGFAGNVFGGGGVAPRIIPEFTWGGGKDFAEYRLAEAKATAVSACRRRNVDFTEDDERLFEIIFKESATFRGGFLAGDDR